MVLTTEISLALITGVVISLVEVAKTLGLPSRFAPLLSVLLGVGSLLLLAFFQPATEVIFTGLVIGLSACGLYSGVKSLAGK
jgi:thiamine transporter ThiT